MLVVVEHDKFVQLLDYLGNSMTYNMAKPVIDMLDKCLVDLTKDELLDVLGVDSNQ
jgi:hypothetical protein